MGYNGILLRCFSGWFGRYVGFIWLDHACICCLGGGLGGTLFAVVAEQDIRASFVMLFWLMYDFTSLPF